MDPLIDMTTFINRCENCGIPKNIKDHPELYNLNETNLNNLKLILPYIKIYLNDNLETQKLIDLIYKIKHCQDKSINNNVLEQDNEYELKKMVDKKIIEKTNELSKQVTDLAEENNNLKNKLNEKNKENKVINDDIELERKKNDKLEQLYNNTDKQYNYKLKQQKEEDIIKINKLENKLDKKDNEIKLLNEQKNNEIKILNEKKYDEIKLLNEKLYQTSGMSNNSQRRGVIGENITENQFIPDGWNVITKAKIKNSGDHELINPVSENKICVDSKNYSNNVPSKEVSKLVSDVITTDSDGGIIISHNSGISFDQKPLNTIDLKFLSSKPILFICNSNQIPINQIKELIIMFDTIITSIKGDNNNYNNNIIIKKKIINTIQSLNESMTNLMKIKESLNKQKGSFEYWHNNIIKNSDKLENEINAIISNIQKDINLSSDNNIELSNIINKPNTDGYSNVEISILKDALISKMDINIDTNTENISHLDDIVSQLSSDSSESNNDEQINMEINDNIDTNNFSFGISDSDLESSDLDCSDLEINNNITSLDQLLKICGNDKLQQNSKRDIWNVLKNWCNKNNRNELINNIHQKHIHQYVENSGYKPIYKHGKNYKGYTRRKKNETYNINLTKLL